MHKLFGSRAMLGICAAAVLLLAGLAMVQYRWSARVAAADAQREREHLESAASLFANEFNDLTAKTLDFLQNDAATAVKSGGKLPALPKLIGELYFLEKTQQGALKAQRLGESGRFEAAAMPSWLPVAGCAGAVLSKPPALITPIYDVRLFEQPAKNGVRILHTIDQGSQRCFVARLNTAYLQNELFPQLIQRSFGTTSVQEYDFSVVAKDPPGERLYGAPLQADLRKPFYSLAPIRLPRTGLRGEGEAPRHNALVVQRIESTIVTRFGGPLPQLLGEEIWELEVARKGMPLAAAFEHARRRSLLLSLSVEVLLLLAFLLLVLAARRTQQLADQRMQFVAGVSHELRTPLSSISMLSKNQADGLVAGQDRVRRYGELIHNESRRLSEMVEHTLEYAGIHSGLRRRTNHALNLGALIAEAVEARREQLSRAGFQVEIDVSPNLPAVSGDAQLLRTAIDNLLSNAEKFADGERWIRVCAQHAAAEKEVRISVEDRGTGIDPAEQADIFEPFSRGRSAIEAQVPGSGLGLSLVRSAVEAHRGTVTVVSEPGRGSTFTLHLPL